MSDLTRRGFLAVAGGGAWLAFPGRAGVAVDSAPAAAFPRQDPTLVEAVVRFSHFDLDAVRELVSVRPALARASWDWGFGDWETPLGAASHVGRPDIANHLLAHGARPTIFTFAMLGDAAAVRALVEARPDIRGITGPHGLSLLHHARAGGALAAEVVAYLEEVGGADPRATDVALSGAERAAYLGDYRLGGDPGTAFRIIERRDHIAFQYGEEASRDLLNQGGHEFHPVGAPAVRFRFEVTGDAAVGVTIRDGDASHIARRALQ